MAVIVPRNIGNDSTVPVAVVVVGSGSGIGSGIGSGSGSGSSASSGLGAYKCGCYNRAGMDAIRGAMRGKRD